MAKWYCCVAVSLLLCLAVGAAARGVPASGGDGCGTAVDVPAGREGDADGAGFDDAKTVFAGSNGAGAGGIFGGGPFGGGIAGFGPHGGFGAGAGPFGGFGGGGVVP